MSVRLVLTVVMRMHSVLTLMAATRVPATLGSLEMESPAMVCTITLQLYIIIVCMPV